MKELSLLQTGAPFVANDIVFIAEAARVERLRHRLAMCSDTSPEEQLEYQRRRALLLTYLAERTGDKADRVLAEKAWSSVRNLSAEIADHAAVADPAADSGAA